MADYPDVKEGVHALIWSPFTCGASVLMYLAVVWLLKKWMTDRKEFQLKDAMKAYNLAQVLLCAYMCYGLWSTPFDNFFRLNTEYNATAEYFIYVHYLSKGLDFCDTLFMCLRKRFNQISFLHVFHHATIPCIWSLLLWQNAGYGTVTLGAFANSLIHCIMYSHYFAASCGIRNPLKFLVTKCQLLQFSILILHSVVALVWEVKIAKWLCIVQFAYQICMYVMFTGFYKRTYKEKAKKVE